METGQAATVIAIRLVVHDALGVAVAQRRVAVTGRCSGPLVRVFSFAAQSVPIVSFSATTDIGPILFAVSAVGLRRAGFFGSPRTALI